MGDRRTSLVDHNAQRLHFIPPSLPQGGCVFVFLSFPPKMQAASPPKDFKILPMKISTQQLMFASGHFLRIRQWGGHLQKGTILYQVWRNDRWLLVTKSLMWYRI
jgi:hypothetical protein